MAQGLQFIKKYVRLDKIIHSITELLSEIPFAVSCSYEANILFLLLLLI
jgi:hypothetical protein